MNGSYIIEKTKTLFSKTLNSDVARNLIWRTERNVPFGKNFKAFANSLLLIVNIKANQSCQRRTMLFMADFLSNGLYEKVMICF